MQQREQPLALVTAPVTRASRNCNVIRAAYVGQWEGQMGAAAPLVLVIDDDEAVVDFYHFILAAAGYRVATAPDGAHGLRLTDELSPDLIVLDLRMPVVGGLEFLRALGQSHDKGKPPVIVNSSDVNARDEALEAGATWFLAKPVASASLLAAIEMTLAKVESTPAIVDQRVTDIGQRYRESGEARERMLASLDPDDPELRQRLSALVEWLAGYFQLGMVWIDLIKGGSIYVQAAHCNGGRLPHAVEEELKIAAAVADARTPFLVGDLRAQTWFAAHPAAHAGYRFFAGVPLRGPRDVSLGALCLADLAPRTFDSSDLMILEHCGVEFGHRIACMAGEAVPGPFLFNRPSVLSRATLEVLLAAELVRSQRRTGALELALVQLPDGPPDGVRQSALAAYAGVDYRNCAVASYEPSVLAILIKGHNHNEVARAIDAAMGAMPRRLGAGVVSFGFSPGTGLWAADLERAAEQALLAATAGGSVRRVRVWREPSSAAIP